MIGPNRAGKTTPLKTISRLIKPYSGKTMLRRREITGLAPHAVATAGISHVPQGDRPFANMSVRDNLLMAAYGHRESLKNGVLEEVFAIFPVLKERQSQLAKTLSGGERQMLAIGRGLAASPDLLMLDEPSLGLAPKLVDEIYQKLYTLRERGLTVLLVEQNITYALELADRGYVLENGRIVLEGSGEELAQSVHIKKHYLGL